MRPKSMLDPQVIQLYHQQRRDNPRMSAKTALEFARIEATDRAFARALDWQPIDDVAAELGVQPRDLVPYGSPIDNECAVITVEGLTVVAFIYGDDDSDPFDDAALGNFVREWREGAIRNPYGMNESANGLIWLRDVHGTKQRWYHPPRKLRKRANELDCYTPRDQEEWFMSGETYAGYRKYYDKGHQQGMSRGVRDLLARQSLRQHWDSFIDLWKECQYTNPMLDVAAVVVYAGEVSDDTGIRGVYEDSHDRRHIAECVRELASQVVHEFRNSGKMAAREADAISIAL